MNDLNAHIPTAEVEDDIAETLREIGVLQGEVMALEATPNGSADFKMAHFKASAKRSGIKEREIFIEALREILHERANKTGKQ